MLHNEQPKVRLHLVGGFLGSGKTTAIIAAARLLMEEGLRVGVVTNDQGKYLVDTAFVRLADLPAVEVTGGCFCCNYNDLNQQLLGLIDDAQPDVVFAESVGSCADIVATVVKPLLALGDQRIQPSSFSVFADSRLLLRRVKGMALPFSEDVVYIFDKQMEEAGLLVLNKMDLLTPTEQKTLEEWASGRKGCSSWRFQNSHNMVSVRGWVQALQGGEIPLPESTLEIDYDRYGRGEAQMAWLDETLTLTVSRGEGRGVVTGIIAALLAVFERERVAIGHLKFVLTGGAKPTKLSFTGLEASGWEAEIPEMPGETIQLLVNIRGETEAALLQKFLHRAVEKVQGRTTFDFIETHVEFFHPAKPEPTHRLS